MARRLVGRIGPVDPPHACMYFVFKTLSFSIPCVTGRAVSFAFILCTCDTHVYMHVSFAVIFPPTQTKLDYNDKADDGVFWMALPDFLESYRSIYVCKTLDESRWVKTMKTVTFRPMTLLL